MARYALLVGISEYRSSRLPNLSKTATDAQAVANLLKKSDLFQEITILTENVTGKKLGEKLQTLLRQQASKNEALIYFTGHCVTVTGNLGEKRGTLATSDCEPEWHNQQVVGISGGIALDELNELIRKSDLSNLVVILDCCHAEYFLEQGLVTRLTAFSLNIDYYFITACRSFEQARAKRSETHSVFTGALIAALSPDNADKVGVISGDRLFDALSRQLKHSGQEPIHMGWGRSIPIVKYSIKEPKSLTPKELRRDNPYLGLSSFDAAQAEYFYGRERAVRELLDRLTQSRFIAVIGASGCGKSSLVKAGLLPQLQSDRIPGSGQWDIVLCTPGQYPLQNLTEILHQQHQRNQPFLLFVDQFEELFTLCRYQEEQQQFIRMLSEEVNNPEVRILIAIRGDFLDRCTQFPEVVKLINSTEPPGTYVVTPLTFTELEEAIEKPAALHGVTYEQGLVSQIAADVVGQPGALPLLQYALQELWRNCIEDKAESYLTKQAYKKIGRVQGALKRRADLLYESFSTADQAFVRQLMMELVELGNGQEVTRRRTSWKRLREIADTPFALEWVISQLTNQRLIVTDAKTIEVAHEALLSEWTLLKGWIEENRENIRLRRRLENYCREWLEKEKSEAYLLTTGRLAAIEEWVEKCQPRLPEIEAEYLSRSQEKRDREKKAKLRRERRIWQLLVGLFATGGFAIATGGLIAAGIAQKGELEILTTQVEIHFNNHQQLEALQASVKVLDKMRKVWINPIINRNFYLRRLQPVIYSIRERNRLQGNNKILYSVTISPNSKMIASSGSDRIITLWTIEGKPLTKFNGHDKEIYSVRFSHNGKFIGSAGFDGTVNVWDVEEIKQGE
uniref:nSTAND1 domain-containing NTPase n=1 Tax=Mastigocoleus sp. MO_188.B34 TaxID=3036635 RepID=UPI0026134288